MTDGAADCHLHVFDPQRFPYDPQAAYRPGGHETATAEQLIEVLDAHGVAHALVVTPTSGYGADNRAAEDAIRSFPARLRGIAVVPPDVPEAELARLRAAGFSGARVDLLAHGTHHLAGSARRLVGLLREAGMVLQLHIEGAQVEAVAPFLRAEAGTVVFDHMGRPEAGQGLDQPGFRALLGLADLDRAAVKLSGPFRFGGAAYPWGFGDAFAEAVLAAYGPERCVWGSDWPFVQMQRRMDYGPCLAALTRWVPDEAARRTILCDTPRRLFGFGAAG